ncbi:MAG: tetratricopeptide repeat protein [Gemmatimonadota bacterium]|nr:tetratricopeptide repeat protein [Gemmatimonadota bacterium]
MKLEEEIRELENRYSGDPQSRLFLPLADALYRADELERAAELCREGLERFPDFTSARALLSQCLGRLGKGREAEETLEELIAIDGANIQVLKELADHARSRGDSDQAAEIDRKVTIIQRSGERSLIEGIGAKGKDGETGEVSDRSIGASPMEEGAAGEEADEREATAAEEKGSANEDKKEPVGPHGRGELFITHTLADIYRLQGHYKRAYDIYQKLFERDVEGERRELERKLEEIGIHLEEKELPESIEPVSGQNREHEGQGPPGREPEGEEGEEIETRVDGIFNVLLGDKPAPEEQGTTEAEEPEKEETPGRGTGADEFIEMVEQWISGLK